MGLCQNEVWRFVYGVFQWRKGGGRRKSDQWRKREGRRKRKKSDHERERDREREKESSVQKREKVCFDVGCWNNIKWLFKEKRVYNRQSDVGVFVKSLCKIEKVGSYTKIKNIYIY